MKKIIEYTFEGKKELGIVGKATPLKDDLGNELKVGDVVTYEDLLYASMLPSGADATDSLAISLTGSISSFVEKMNDLAKKLNLTGLKFSNTTGYDA